MNTATKVTGFAVGLVVAFGAAFAAGAWAEPDIADAATSSDSHDVAAGTEHDDHNAEMAAPPAGLSITDEGYTLALAATTAPEGTEAPISFSIFGPDGHAVTEYRPTHDKDLHLIAIRRDTTGFQHLHPVLAADGTWTATIDLTAGDWRLFADFAPAALPAEQNALVLGADLAVAGNYEPAALPAVSESFAVDGYQVSLAAPDLAPGVETELVLTIERDGAPVTDLEPYLAAYGHLVALRVGDLAYLHVHPTHSPGDGTPAGPSISFASTFPTAGNYRLYLDFQHDGLVRTAEFTVTVGGDHDHS